MIRSSRQNKNNNSNNNNNNTTRLFKQRCNNNSNNEEEKMTSSLLLLLLLLSSLSSFLFRNQGGLLLLLLVGLIFLCHEVVIVSATTTTSSNDVATFAFYHHNQRRNHQMIIQQQQQLQKEKQQQQYHNGQRIVFPSLTTAIYASNKNSKKNKKKTTKKKKFASVGAPLLSHEELATHVSTSYIEKKNRKVEIPQHSKLGQQQNNKNGSSSSSGSLNLNQHPALVLNADYQPLSHLPLSLWHWQEAVKAIFSGKCTVVDVYPDVTIRTANFDIPLPSVIALNEYVPLHSKTSRPAFTKRNVFLRDGYRCQYCNNIFHTRDLSLDHVKPRCLGGRLTWDNTVTSCKKCNGRKGCYEVKDLKHIGMKLNRIPTTPTSYELAMIATTMLPRKKNIHNTWEPYLGMENDNHNNHNHNDNNDNDKTSSSSSSL